MGVGFPELLEGELSVAIRSLSLSESSLGTRRPRRRSCSLILVASGLCRRDSERKVAFGAKRLGRRNRTEMGLGSKGAGADSSELAEYVDDVAPTEIELDELGKAKSEEEVGNGGRIDAFDMTGDVGEDERGVLRANADD